MIRSPMSYSAIKSYSAQLKHALSASHCPVRVSKLLFWEMFGSPFPSKSQLRRTRVTHPNWLIPNVGESSANFCQGSVKLSAAGG